MYYDSETAEWFVNKTRESARRLGEKPDSIYVEETVRSDAFGDEYDAWCVYACSDESWPDSFGDAIVYFDEQRDALQFARRVGKLLKLPVEMV